MENVNETDRRRVDATELHIEPGGDEGPSGEEKHYMKSI